MTWFPRLSRLPLTVRVPVMVVILMVAVSAVISERVLDRLANNQETYLEGLASAYLDGVIASITPSVLREDSWEVYDGIARMRPTADDIMPKETIVTGKSGLVLASSDPKARATLFPLEPSFIARFKGEGVAIDPNTRSGFVRRDIIYQKQFIGEVYAVFDISSLLAERWQILTTLLATNASFTVLFGLIGFVMVRRMVKPMQVLERHMVDAATGTPTLVAQSEFPVANGEVADLYRAYNALVHAEAEKQVFARHLAEEEKLASLGRLASGMAHEINNPLGGLMNVVGTLRMHGDKKSVRDASIELIERGLLGIREVVEATLATYRPERLKRPLGESDFTDLKLLVRPELRRKRQKLNFGVQGKLDIEPNWPAGPIRQAVLNLLLNAVAATPDGGTIEVRVEASAAALAVEVSDEGSGMPQGAQAILMRIKDSVPPPDESGLGLWVVREIANDLGATIGIASVNGAATAVSLSIPRKNPGVSSAA